MHTGVAVRVVPFTILLSWSWCILHRWNQEKAFISCAMNARNISAGANHMAMKGGEGCADGCCNLPIEVKT